MRQIDPSPIAAGKLAGSAVIGAIALNLILRSSGKFSGVIATLACAAITPLGIRLWVRLRYQRQMHSGERLRVLLLYSAILALLYIGLLCSMAVQNNPSPMAVLIFGLHYFCYPLLAWLITRPRPN